MTRSALRIGTWNLAGRWSERHLRFLQEPGCDVWLLTEVGAKTHLDSGTLVRSEEMPRTGGRSWAAVWGTGLEWAEPPHPAAALAVRDGVTFLSCVLPWRGARDTWPDRAPNTAGRTVAALERLRSVVARGGPVVWGGDGNHAADGPEYAGSKAGREAILDLVETAGLRLVTGDQPHRIDGLLSIDHVAVPRTWATTARRLAARDDRGFLSDHDAYVVDVLPVRIEGVTAEEVRPLRGRVLRPGQGAGELVYPGDGMEGTLHAAARDGDGVVVGIATLSAEPHPADPRPGDWRLRGMATAPEVRGTGLGSALLRRCLEHAAARGGARVWCNARRTAEGFYAAHGFAAEGPEFELPGIGAHVVMARPVP